MTDLKNTLNVRDHDNDRSWMTDEDMKLWFAILTPRISSTLLFEEMKPLVAELELRRVDATRQTLPRLGRPVTFSRTIIGASFLPFNSHVSLIPKFATATHRCDEAIQAAYNMTIARHSENLERQFSAIQQLRKIEMEKYAAALEKSAALKWRLLVSRSAHRRLRTAGASPGFLNQEGSDGDPTEMAAKPAAKVPKQKRESNDGKGKGSPVKSSTEFSHPLSRPLESEAH
jgi:hypothetical protein